MVQIMITVMSYLVCKPFADCLAYGSSITDRSGSDPVDRIAGIECEISTEIDNSGVYLSNQRTKKGTTSMPNLVMEYSNSVDERVNVQGLLEDLHFVVLQSGLFDTLSVKSRALRCHHWLLGDEGDSSDFIHIGFELLAGRTEEQKRDLSRQLMAVLQQQAGHVRSLTVNIRDMDPSCFQKIIN